MFADARRIPAGTTLDVDLCVVGAGAAGLAIGRELAGTPLRVAIVESGGLAPDARAQRLNDGDRAGLPYFPLASARLREFGGTTGHWDGLTRPFEEIDFEPRAGIPRSGWPIRKRDLEPFYPRAAKFCGLPVDRWDGAYWQDRDGSAPAALPGGEVVNRFAQQVPVKARRFGTAHREDLRRAPNVTVYLHATVTELEADEPARRITAARVATLGGGPRFTVRARRFVVAVGGIENPRLLLASTSRRPHGLGNDHDLVGRFFLEHPRYVAATLVPAGRRFPTKFYDAHGVGPATIRGYLGLADAVKRREGLVDVQLRMEPRFERAYADAAASGDVAAVKALRHGLGDKAFADDLAAVFEDVMSWHVLTVPGAPLPVPTPEVASKLATARPGELRSLLPDLLGDLAATAMKETDRAPVAAVGLRTRIEPVPNPDSRVRLGSQRDELGMRRAVLDWRLSDLDRHSVRRTVEIFAGEAGRAGIGRVRLQPDAGDGSWPADLAGGWHHMGTTRMADDPRHGVVDRDCRVHGIANLHIAGSSVFATAGSGTPTLTLVALALRLADHLKAVLR